MSFVFIHRTVNVVYKRVCRNCPISSCGAKYLVRLANHLADVHQLDHIQRRQYLQEAKLQPKVKVVVYESEADNSGKNHYHNPVQTRETLTCELTRSQRNETFLKQNLKDRLQRTRRSARNKESRTLIQPRILFIHHKTRMLSLSWVLNSTAVTVIQLFSVN